MDRETAYYIVNYFGRLLTQNENAALRHNHAMSKIGPKEKYKTLEQYELKVKFYERGNYLFFDSPAVLQLLEKGIENFHITTASRIIEQTPELVYFNRCPRCQQLARTPYAKQCRRCGHNWHNVIGANFKIKKILEISGKPQFLYFAGELIDGRVKKGMRIDLTFMSVAEKPIIESIGFADHVAMGTADVVLGAKINSIENSVYLKRRGEMAIPVIIEKAEVKKWRWWLK